MVETASRVEPGSQHRILFLCGAKRSYTRNASLRKALSLFAEVQDISVDASGYSKRHLQLIWRLLCAHRDYDVVFVGFYGQLLVPIVRLVTGKPIVFDAFISTYQTLCFDRKVVRPKSLIGRLAFFIDRFACRLARVVILDTQAHIDYFIRTYKLPREKFRRIYVGAEEDIFYPRTTEANKRPLIFTYSSFQPLHGVEYIVRAAKELEDMADFLIIGTGMEREKTDRLIESLAVKNIQQIDHVPYAKLADYIAQADICLGGHFADTEKAGLVIAGKTFQFVAMKKCTVLSDNQANRELFGSGLGLFSVPPADPINLALLIRSLLSDPGAVTRLAHGQYEVYYCHASGQNILTDMIKVVEGACI